MSGTQTGILKPLTGPLVLQPLKSNPMRTLGLVLVMRGNGALVTNFTHRVLAALKELSPNKIEVIIVDHDIDEHSFAKAKYLIQRHQSIYLMRVSQNNNGAEALFRAWQRSKASILGHIEIGDIAALTALPTMLTIAKNALDSEETDVVVGYRRLSTRWGIVPSRSTINTIITQAYGKIIMPDLFLSSAHPLSTCLFVRRDILQERKMTLYGDSMLPNLITNIPRMKITEIPYADQKIMGTTEQKGGRVSLRTLAPALFHLNIFHKTHILLDQ